MMKKVHIALLAILFTSLAGMAWAQAPSAEKPDPEKGKPLPNFVFQSVDGFAVTPDLLPASQPLVIFYFDPDCDHCEQQAKWVREKIASFQGVALLWVSWGEIPDIIRFRDTHFSGVKKADMVFAKDANYKIDTWFGYCEVPTIIVYNKGHIRTETFRKETAVDLILNATRK